MALGGRLMISMMNRKLPYRWHRHNTFSMSCIYGLSRIRLPLDVSRPGFVLFVAKAIGYDCVQSSASGRMLLSCARHTFGQTNKQVRHLREQSTILHGTDNIYKYVYIISAPVNGSSTDSVDGTIRLQVVRFDDGKLSWAELESDSGNKERTSAHTHAHVR